jgi:hypothetical protein
LRTRTGATPELFAQQYQCAAQQSKAAIEQVRNERLAIVQPKRNSTRENEEKDCNGNQSLSRKLGAKKILDNGERVEHAQLPLPSLPSIQITATRAKEQDQPKDGTKYYY